MPEIATAPPYPFHRQYRHRVAGAHQRQIISIKSPSIVRHLCLWQGYSAEQDDNATSRFDAEDAYIVNFHRKLATLSDLGQVKALAGQKEFFTPEAVTESAGHAITPLLSSSINLKSYLRCIGDERSDRWRTIRLDFKWRGIPVTMTFDSHVEHMLATTYFHLAGYRKSGDFLVEGAVLDLRLIIRSLQSKGIGGIDAVCSAMAYEQIWSEFDQEIHSGIDAHGIGKIVADSRGLILRPKGLAEAAMLGNSLCTELYHAWDNVYQDGPADTSHDHSHRKAEFTITAMMGRRAMHATSLGHHNLTSETRQPMRYIIAENLPNDFQLGRLIFRINRAGMARICATMHWEKLNDIGKLLRKAEVELGRGLWGNQPSSDGEAPSEEGAPVRSSEDRKSDIGSAIETCDGLMRTIAAEDIGGGVAYRSERSRQYVDEFERVTRDLRLGRTDGFQRYDEYVRQRLGTAFDYIGAMGERYTRVQAGIVQMRQVQRSFQALSFGEKIADAQQFADIALWAFLMPYYVGSTFSHLLPHDAGQAMNQLIWVCSIWAGLIILVQTQNLTIAFSWTGVVNSVLLRGTPGKIRVELARLVGVKKIGRVRQKALRVAIVTVLATTLALFGLSNANEVRCRIQSLEAAIIDPNDMKTPKLQEGPEACSPQQAGTGTTEGQSQGPSH